jgi:hypothetical protein
MFVQTERCQCQGVWTVKELQRAVAMPAVTPAANDELVQMFVVPAHGELHHMMQLRDRNLLGNQQAPSDRRADAPQTDSQLEHGSGLGRIAEHRPTIAAPLSHIHRSDFSPRFGAVSQRGC